MHSIYSINGNTSIPTNHSGGPRTLTEILSMNLKEDIVLVFFKYIPHNVSSSVLNMKISPEIESFILSGEKDKELDISNNLTTNTFTEFDEAKIRFNKESEKYEVYLLIKDLDILPCIKDKEGTYEEVSYRFSRSGKVYDNLKDAVLGK